MKKQIVLLAVVAVIAIAGLLQLSYEQAYANATCSNGFCNSTNRCFSGCACTPQEGGSPYQATCYTCWWMNTLSCN